MSQTTCKIINYQQSSNLHQNDQQSCNFHQNDHQSSKFHQNDQQSINLHQNDLDQNDPSSCNFHQHNQSNKFHQNDQQSINLHQNDDQNDPSSCNFDQNQFKNHSHIRLQKQSSHCIERDNNYDKQMQLHQFIQVNELNYQPNTNQIIKYYVQNQLTNHIQDQLQQDYQEQFHYNHENHENHENLNENNLKVSSKINNNEKHQVINDSDEIHLNNQSKIKNQKNNSIFIDGQQLQNKQKFHQQSKVNISKGMENNMSISQNKGFVIESNKSSINQNQSNISQSVSETKSFVKQEQQTIQIEEIKDYCQSTEFKKKCQTINCQANQKPIAKQFKPKHEYKDSLQYSENTNHVICYKDNHNLGNNDKIFLYQNNRKKDIEFIQSKQQLIFEKKDSKISQKSIQISVLDEDHLILSKNQNSKISIQNQKNCNLNYKIIENKQNKSFLGEELNSYQNQFDIQIHSIHNDSSMIQISSELQENTQNQQNENNKAYKIVHQYDEIQEKILDYRKFNQEEEEHQFYQSQKYQNKKFNNNANQKRIETQCHEKQNQGSSIKLKFKNLQKNQRDNQTSEPNRSLFQTQISNSNITQTNNKLAKIRQAKEYKKRKLLEDLEKLNDEIKILSKKEEQIRQFGSPAKNIVERIKINDNMEARQKALSLVKNLQKQKKQRNMERVESLQKIDMNINAYMSELTKIRSENERKMKERRKIQIIERMKKKQVQKMNDMKKIQASSKFVTHLNKNNEFKQEIIPQVKPQSPPIQDNIYDRKRTFSKVTEQDEGLPEISSHNKYINRVRALSQKKQRFEKQRQNLYQQRLN